MPASTSVMVLMVLLSKRMGRRGMEGVKPRIHIPLSVWLMQSADLNATTNGLFNKQSFRFYAITLLESGQLMEESMFDLISDLALSKPSLETRCRRNIPTCRCGNLEAADLFNEQCALFSAYFGS